MMKSLKEVIIIRVFLFWFFFLFVNSVDSVNNPKLQIHSSFLIKFSGWGGKNHIRPVPIPKGTQRRLFYLPDGCQAGSLQPFDLYLFTFFDIIRVIATMHNLPCSFPHKADQPLAERAKNNSLLVSNFSVKLRIREFLSYRAYKTQGCREANYLLVT